MRLEHLGGGGASEGDGEDLFGLLDGGEQSEVAGGEKAGFAGAGGGLHEDGAGGVDGSGAGRGVVGGARGCGCWICS